MALRTTSTTQDISVIGNLDMGTSTKMSGLQIPPTDINIEGATEGFVGTPYEFDYQVLIDQVMTPLTVTVTTTDQGDPLVGLINRTDSTYTAQWVSPGTKTITIRAENCLGAVTQTHQIEIVGLLAEALQVTGPTTGVAGQEYTFDVVVNQPFVAVPINVRIEATDKDPAEAIVDTPGATYKTTWTTNGTKVVTFILSNGGDPVEVEHTIVIGNANVNPPVDNPPVDNPPVEDPPVADPPSGSAGYKIFLPNISG